MTYASGRGPATGSIPITYFILVPERRGDGATTVKALTGSSSAVGCSRNRYFRAIDPRSRGRVACRGRARASSTGDVQTPQTSSTDWRRRRSARRSRAHSWAALGRDGCTCARASSDNCIMHDVAERACRCA
ncbi:hypothetical protein EVAR_57649_1 [Eumeta japonica]|uniref:Uncharacterized protein n=1 Tax=Eumeta variegata TaxID=151549 RepID=A0A4C1Z8L6_EUMVA|nr:hypothetical protein EVAR_57649_1 [Eumeta japonica]